MSAGENVLAAARVVDEIPGHTYVFLGATRFASERKDLPVTGLPQKLALLLGLLVAFLLVASAGAPVLAHGFHPHHATVERYQTALPSQASDPSRASTTRDVEAHAASKNGIPIEAPRRSGDTDCCCGSLMCHAGLTLPVALVPLPYTRAERV